MKIAIVCVGKIKEKYLQEGIAEYTKRLTPFCRLETISIAEEKMPGNPSAAEKAQVIARECERLIAVIPDNARVLLLDLAGGALTSAELAAELAQAALHGTGTVAFVIGGAFGISDNLRKRADRCLSFSRLTFTHQMIRLILTEQIYRAYKINRGEKYHW